MKNYLLYILVFITVALTACDPMKDTIREVVPDNNSYTKALNLTIATSYPTTTAANTAIAATLNTTYPHLGNGSTASVNYNSTATLPAQIKPVDSLLSNVQYTVTDADYATTNGTTFKNFSAAKVLEFLAAKYNAPIEKQLVVLNYVYYESGATTSAGVPVTETFLYLNGAWIKGYQISQAQYVSAGKLTVFNFGSADEPNLNGYFNTFLKSDASVAAKAKSGDVKYVSFAYFASSKTYQRIKVLVFDGANWAYKTVPATTTLTFLKKDGKWIADPTVFYTMVAADYTNLNLTGVTYTFGTATNRGNVAQYKSFNINATNGTQWTTDEIKQALIYTLNTRFPNAASDPGIEYKITYYAYSGSYAYITVIFTKAATGFVEKT